MTFARWLADNLRSLQAEARRRGEPIPMKLPVDMPVFNVPKQLVRILDSDLKRANNQTREARGHTPEVPPLPNNPSTDQTARAVSLS